MLDWDQKAHPEPEAIMLPLLLLEGLHSCLRKSYQRYTASLDVSGASWIPSAKTKEFVFVGKRCQFTKSLA